MLNFRKKEVEVEIFNLASELKAEMDNSRQKNEAFKSQALNRVTLCMFLLFKGLDVVDKICCSVSYALFSLF